MVLPLVQEKIAVVEAPDGIEKRKLRLQFFLHLFSLTESRLRFGYSASLKERVGEHRPADHSPRAATTPVGEFDGLLGVGGGLAQVPKRKVELADVFSTDS